MRPICLDSDDEDENDSALLNFEPLRKRPKPAQASEPSRPSVASHSENIEGDDSGCASISSYKLNKETSTQRARHQEVPILQSGEPLHVDASEASDSVGETAHLDGDCKAMDDSSCDTKELAWKIMHPNMPYPKPLVDSSPAAKRGAMKTSTEAAAVASPADDFCLPDQDSSSSSCSAESDFERENDEIKIGQCSVDPARVPQFVSLGPRDGSSSTPAHPSSTQIETISRNLSPSPTRNENRDVSTGVSDQPDASPAVCKRSEEAVFFPEEDHALDHRHASSPRHGRIDTTGPYHEVDHPGCIHPSMNVRVGLHPQRQVLIMQNEADPLLNGEDDIETFSDDDQPTFGLRRNSFHSNDHWMSSHGPGSSARARQPFRSRNDSQSPQNQWQAVEAVQRGPPDDSQHGSFEDAETFRPYERYTQPEVSDVYANNGVDEFHQRSLPGRRIIRNAATSNTAHLTGIVLPHRNDAHDFNYQSAPYRNDLTGGSGVEASHGGGYYSFVTNRPLARAAGPSTGAMFNGDSGDATFGSSYGYRDDENLDVNVPDTGRRSKASRSASSARNSSAQRGRRATGRGGFRKKRSWGKSGKANGRGRANSRAAATGSGRLGRSRGGGNQGAGWGSGTTAGRDDPNLGHVGGADINF